MADHAGAGHLAERADMRQAGRAVAGLEQRLGLAGPLEALNQLARLLERPGIGRLGRSELAIAQRLGTGSGKVNTRPPRPALRTG
jgi:hypothetical protein